MPQRSMSVGEAGTGGRTDSQKLEIFGDPIKVFQQGDDGHWIRVVVQKAGVKVQSSQCKVTAVALAIFGFLWPIL